MFSLLFFLVKRLSNLKDQRIKGSTAAGGGPQRINRRRRRPKDQPPPKAAPKDQLPPKAVKGPKDQPPKAAPPKGSTAAEDGQRINPRKRQSKGQSTNSTGSDPKRINRVANEVETPMAVINIIF